MASIQISKYKRPGIFIEEYDQSQLANIVPVQGITNMVIGFSRKGPVNTPVLLNTVNDSVGVFGPIDRSLERKGSFFHRTVQKMLQSSPVYALNLLDTDALDVIQFRTLSASTGLLNSDHLHNGGIPIDSYSKFFNRAGFWKRDTKSFLDDVSVNPSTQPYTYLKSLETVLNLTNLSDKVITAFVFKSSVTGYDVSLVQYYGSADKVPSYLYPTDYASDYLVDVIVVSGDWSDYHSLSLDSTWSKYFDSTGLLKGKASSFVNDRNVNLLAYYQGASLVPYFRTPSGVNIFIETLINNDTDKTGLFCAFNIDMFETDYPNGMVDLIGNNLANPDNATQSTIDFLSYNDAITSSISYPRVDLDKPGNTWAIIDPNYDGNYRTPGDIYSKYGRGAIYSEGYVYGVTASFSYATASKVLTASVKVYDTPYVVINGKKVTIVDNAGATLSTTLNLTTSYSATNSYVSTLYVKPDGTVNLTTSSTPSYVATPTNPSVGTSDIVFAYSTTHVGTSTSSFDWTGVSCDDGGFVELEMGVDYDYTTDMSGLLTFWYYDVETTTTTSEYEKFRRQHSFNYITNILGSSNKNKGCVIYGYSKQSLVNNTFAITTNHNGYEFTLTGWQQDANVFIIYAIDDEFVLGSDGGYGGSTGNSMLSGSNFSPIATDYFGQIGKYSKLYQNYYNGILKEGDYFIGASSSIPYFLGTQFISNDYVKLYYYNTYNGAVASTLSDRTVIASNDDFVSMQTNGIVVISDTNNYKQTIDIVSPSGYVSVPNKILASKSRYTEVKVGDFIQAYVDPSYTSNMNIIDSHSVSEVPKYLTRITSKKVSSFLDDYGNTLVEFTCDAAIDKGDGTQTIRYTKIDDYASTYKAITLNGFRIRNASIPDGTEPKQNSILNLVASGTPLFKALTNKQAIDFRYLIDSFGLGLIENSKQQLMDICGARLDCFGFLNMPSIKSFQNSDNPSFTDSGVINTAYIAEGGNPDTNPDHIYSFGTGAGTTCVGYFTPYLTVNDGRPLDLPPAMFVATTFMKKHNTNITSIVPWTIAAGVTNGKISGFTNVEMDFTNTDIENLNMAQMNPIVYKRNRGFVIETENTAQTEYVSALSYIHVREVLIELERALSAMLLDFQWKFNTADIRAEIKLRADVICEQFVNKNGLYNYFNKCDSENNTADLIDRQIGVLDTYVEPIKSMGIIVNNVTILRTGAIQSGGFQ